MSLPMVGTDNSESAGELGWGGFWKRNSTCVLREAWICLGKSGVVPGPIYNGATNFPGMALIQVEKGTRFIEPKPGRGFAYVVEERDILMAVPQICHLEAYLTPEQRRRPAFSRRTCDRREKAFRPIGEQRGSALLMGGGWPVEDPRLAVQKARFSGPVGRCSGGWAWWKWEAGEEVSWGHNRIA